MNRDYSVGNAGRKYIENPCLEFTYSCICAHNDHSFPTVFGLASSRIKRICQGKDCTYSSPNSLSIPDSQRKLRAVLPKLVVAHCRNFVMLIRLQQHPGRNGNAYHRKLELRHDLESLSPFLWDLHCLGIQVDLAFGNRKCPASAVTQSHLRAHLHWQVYEYELWA
jgi:hypothetical protein